MENFLTKFFDDNSVCTGLCDLKRKTETAQLNYYYAQQQAVRPQMRPQVQKPVQQTVKQTTQMPQAKPQKQSLAQIFAAQQQAYAAQQAYNAQQKTQQFRTNMQQQAQQQYQKPQVNTVQKQSYVQNANPQALNSRVIVNGSMKKVVSAAVPARY